MSKKAKTKKKVEVKTEPCVKEAMSTTAAWAVGDYGDPQTVHCGCKKCQSAPAFIG